MPTTELVHVPAADLIVDPNVRRTVDVDKSFISSIRNHGILQPPVGWKDEAGKIHITMGQRRTVAAQKLGLDSVPVILTTQAEAEQARIVAQLAENEQRSNLNASDTAAAYAQLQFEFGVTPEQIARKTNSPRAKVDTAIAVSSSAAAKAALDAAPITLEQAAIFTEFDGDEAAVEQLNEVLRDRPEQLEHSAERIRRDAAKRKAVDALVLELETEGWQIIRSEYQYGYTQPAGAVRLQDLHRADDKKKTPLTRADVAGMGGRVAVTFPNYDGTADAAFFMKNAAKHGFESHAYSSGGGGNGPLTDEEKAARRQKREDRADMTAATTVRRAWLKDTFLPAKHTLDKIGTWIVKSMVEHPDALRYDQARDDDAKILACELLGLDIIQGMYSSDALATIEKALAGATTEGELRILLAFAIAKVEYPAGNPKHPRFGQFAQLGPYFEQLTAWGYNLADVEQTLVDEHRKATKR